MESVHFPFYHSPVDIHLLGKGPPGPSMDLCSYGRGWNVIKVSIRKEGPSAVGCQQSSQFSDTTGLPVLNTAVPPMSCPLPRWSHPVIYKVLLPYLRWFQWLIQLLELLRDSVKASVDTVSLFNFCLTLLFFSLYSSPGVNHSLINFTYHYP